MEYNRHTNLAGAHAFLSASQSAWIRYTDEQLENRWRNAEMAILGTETHEFASTCIKRHQKLPKSNKTLNAFVNDAIGYGMESELTLFYSMNCFGTADAVHFDEEKNLLRIYDLKTGVKPAKFDQLKVYTALFCLEYGYDIDKIEVELRIYQNDEIYVDIINDEESRELVKDIMKRIERFSLILDRIKG